MNIHFQDQIPADFPDTSRVWIYQSNRPFSLDETIQIEELLHAFAKSWLSHGAQVKGFGTILFGQFIVLMADETNTGVSGCSTDGSVRLIKNIEQDFNVQLFERTNLAFIVNERIQLVQLLHLNEALESGMLSADTFYFNNSIQTRGELMDNWIIPLKESWLANRIRSETLN